MLHWVSPLNTYQQFLVWIHRRTDPFSHIKHPTSCSDTQMMPEETILRLWSSSSLQLSSWSLWNPESAWMISRLARSTITIHLSAWLLGTVPVGKREVRIHNKGRNKASDLIWNSDLSPPVAQTMINIKTIIYDTRRYMCNIKKWKY